MESRPSEPAAFYGEDFGPVFSCCRILHAADVPSADLRSVDVVILDMHHGWPNLGHDSLVRAIGEIAWDLHPLLESAGMQIRVLSYDVRRCRAIPDPPGDRHRIYIGTGGPGHIDPRRNDGVSEGTQGIREDASWEEPLFKVFDAIREDPDAVLLAVCHTFGVLCRWAGIAKPVLRGPSKGGKSSGIVENVLADEALMHPWFSRFAAELPGWRRFKVLDSRFYDLTLIGRPLPTGVVALSYEREPRNDENDVLTMVEFARDRQGIMPRMLAVNHHPEIRDRRRQRRILDLKYARGEVTAQWYEERARSLDQAFETPEAEHNVLLTSRFALTAPLRFFLYRQVRLRGEAIGHSTDLHEELVVRLPSGVLDREEDYPSHA